MMMNRRNLLAVLAASGSAGIALAQTAPSAVPPQALAAVKAFYDPKVKEDRRPLSRRLAGLYKAAIARSRKDNEPVSGLDFGPEIDGQDIDDGYRKTLKFAAPKGNAEKATVEVSFVRFKGEAPVVLTYTIVNENGWKVDDIAKLGQGDGWTLSALLERGAKGQ